MQSYRRGRSPRWTPAGVAVLIVAMIMGAAESSRAADPFEIQVYDGTANQPMSPGLEVHLNEALGNGTAGVSGASPEQQVLHLTLEPSLGLLPWWEVGAYLQSALEPDGRFVFAGVKLRSKFVTPPRWHANLRLGVNLEVSRESNDRWGGEVRPIIAWWSPHALFAVNPIVGLDAAERRLSFEPAATALFQIPDVFSLGLEYYGDLSAGPQHYVYQVFNLLMFERVEVNFGIGEGLTSASNRLIAKVILGYRFDRASDRGMRQP